MLYLSSKSAVQKESKEKQVTGENEEEKKGNSQMKTERKKDKKD